MAVDVPGVKMVMEAGELAKQKGLGIAAGTQRRHSPSYQETIKRIQDGAIGEIVYARCYWNGGADLGHRARARLERHGVAAPQLELLHLALRRPHRRAARPQPRRHELGARRASGQGRLRPGRPPGPHRRSGTATSSTTSPSSSSIPNGVRDVQPVPPDQRLRRTSSSEAVRGHQRHEQLRRPRSSPSRAKPGASAARIRNPYQQEHEDLIASIRAGKPINEAQAVAESTMTGILGREAVYSGKAIDWDAGHEIRPRGSGRRIRIRPLSDPAGGHAGAVPVRVESAHT